MEGNYRVGTVTRIRAVLAAIIRGFNNASSRTIRKVSIEDARKGGGLYLTRASDASSRYLAIRRLAERTKLESRERREREREKGIIRRRLNHREPLTATIPAADSRHGREERNARVFADETDVSMKLRNSTRYISKMRELRVLQELRMPRISRDSERQRQSNGKEHDNDKTWRIRSIKLQRARDYRDHRASIRARSITYPIKGGN